MVDCSLWEAAFPHLAPCSTKIRRHGKGSMELGPHYSASELLGGVPLALG